MTIRLPEDQARRILHLDKAQAKKPRHKRQRNLFGEVVPPPKERNVQSAVLSYLKARGVFHWRANSFKGWALRACGVKFWLICNFAGCPDILAIRRPHGQLVGIEIKRERDSVQGVDQRACQSDFQREGALYIVARRVEDVMEVWP